MSATREDEVVTMVRSCLLSVKGQMTLTDLNRDYETLVGERIPYRILGYDNLETFLERLPGMEVSRGPNGNMMVNASATSSTKHLADMVSKQKTTKKNVLKSKVQSRPWNNNPQGYNNANLVGGVKPAHSKYLGKNYDPNYRWKPSPANGDSTKIGAVKPTFTKYGTNSQQYVPAPRFQAKMQSSSPSNGPSSSWDEDQPESYSPHCEKEKVEEFVQSPEGAESLELGKLRLNGNGPRVPARRGVHFRGSCKVVVPRGSPIMRSESPLDELDTIITDDNDDYNRLMDFADAKGYPRSKIKKVVLDWITYFSLKLGWFTFEQQMAPGRTLDSVIDSICTNALMTLSRVLLPHEYDFKNPKDPMNRIVKLVYTVDGGVLVSDLPTTYSSTFNEYLQQDWLNMLVDRKTDAIMEVGTANSCLMPLLVPRFLVDPVVQMQKLIDAKIQKELAYQAVLGLFAPAVKEDLDYEVTHGRGQRPPVLVTPESESESDPPQTLGIGYSRRRILFNQAKNAQEQLTAAVEVATDIAPVVQAIGPPTPVPIPTQVAENGLPKGMLWRVLVLHLGLEDILFVRVLAANQESYSFIMTMLEKYIDCGYIPETVLGNCYVVRIKDTYHRVRLDELILQSEQGSVFLLDWGRHETVLLADLRILTPALADIPAQAVQCRLHGWKEVSTVFHVNDILLKMVVGKTMNARRVGLNSDMVTLYHEREPKQPPPLTSVNFEAVEALSQLTRVRQPPKEGESRQFLVEIVHLTGVMYVHSGQDSNPLVGILLKLLPLYQHLQQRCPEVLDASVDTIFLFFWKEELRRVKVLEDVDGELVVALIDLGFKAECLVADLIALDTISIALATLPPLLMKMRLHIPTEYLHLSSAVHKHAKIILPQGTEVMAKTMAMKYDDPVVEVSIVQPGNSMTAVNDSFACARLQRLMPELLPEAEPCQAGATSPDPETSDVSSSESSRTSAFSAVPTSSHLPGGSGIAKILVANALSQARQALLATALPTIPTPSLSVGITPVMPTPMMVRPLLPAPLMPQYPLPPFVIPPMGSQYDIHVAHASSPSTFTVQPYNLGPLNFLMEQMKQYYTVLAQQMPITASAAIPGTVWAVQHIDYHWYRGVVIGAGASVDSVSVMICDYGYVFNMPFNRMCFLEERFRVLPAQSIRAGLFGIKPKHQEWSMIDCILFQELVSDREFVSVVMEKYSTSENPNELKIGLLLIDTSGDIDVRIDQLLVDEQKAVFIEQR